MRGSHKSLTAQQHNNKVHGNMSLIYTARTDASPQKQQRRNSLYLGGQIEAKDMSMLQRFGIRYILNVTPEKEAGIMAGVPNYFEKTGTYVYKRIPVYDNATSDLLIHADKAVAFISNSLHHASVLVHCQKGVSRSATVVLFYLMRKVGLTLEAALNLCKKRRPIVDPIAPFMVQLQQYERTCDELGFIHKTIEAKGTEKETTIKQGVKRKAIGPSSQP